MVTVGSSQLKGAAFELFDGMRTFDAKRATAAMATDADFDSPWSGPLHGKEAIQAFLTTFLADPVNRPSFSIRNVSGDGSVTRLDLSISGRFGKAPEHVTLQLLVLRGVVHQARFVGAGGGKAGH